MKIAMIDFTKTKNIELIGVAIVKEEDLGKMKGLHLKHTREFGGKRRKIYLKAAKKKIEKIKSTGKQGVFWNKERALSFILANIKMGDLVICDDSLFDYFRRRLTKFGVKVIKESGAKKRSDYRALCNLVDTLLRLEVEKYKKGR